jgi:hypothetical protein
MLTTDKLRQQMRAKAFNSLNLVLGAYFTYFIDRALLTGLQAVRQGISGQYKHENVGLNGNDYVQIIKNM